MTACTIRTKSSKTSVDRLRIEFNAGLKQYQTIIKYISIIIHSKYNNEVQIINLIKQILKSQEKLKKSAILARETCAIANRGLKHLCHRIMLPQDRTSKRQNNQIWTFIPALMNHCHRLFQHMSLQNHRCLHNKNKTQAFHTCKFNHQNDN